MGNWGRWSKVDKAILPDIILGDFVFENTLFIRVLELLLTLVGSDIWGKNIWEDRESIN